LVPYDRKEGQRPRLDDDEIDAIVAFLTTLTDAAYRSPTSASSSRDRKSEMALRRSNARIAADR
jgi:hypothetical protein